MNAILPGPVDGPRIRAVIKAKAAAAAISENEMTERTVATTSLKCFVTQQDIANMALYLASPFGATISGQAISVDAGHAIHDVTPNRIGPTPLRRDVT